MKRLFVPLLIAAWLSMPFMVSLTVPQKYRLSAQTPISAQHIAKSLLAQIQDVKLDLSGAGVKDVEQVIMVPKVVTVKTVASFPFTVTAPAGAGLYFWQYPATVTAQDQGDKLQVTAAPKGETQIGVKLISANLDKDGRFIGFVTKFGSISFTVGDVLPGPVPPEPGPKPPEPVPPGPVTGLRVIFITETADESKYPSGQIAAMNSVKVREYLNAKTKGWRHFDKDQDVSKLPEPWPKMWEAIRPQLGKLPQVAIVSDQSGEIFPVPNSTEELLKLLAKYGGN